jgi:protein-disulfide isomerase
LSSRIIKNSILGITLLCIASIALWLLLHKSSQPQTYQVHHIDNSQLPTLGNPNAPLHIVAFEDLKCGNCMHFNVTLLPLIKKYFIDTGKASYSVALLAFIPGSPPAANAAYCIRAQQPLAFFDFVHAIYNNQPPEIEDWATLPNLMRFTAKIPKLNRDKLAKCIANNTYTSFSDQNMNLAAKVMGANQISTPSIYINGIHVMPLNWKNFQRIAKIAEK